MNAVIRLKRSMSLLGCYTSALSLLNFSSSVRVRVICQNIISYKEKEGEASDHHEIGAVGGAMKPLVIPHKKLWIYQLQKLLHVHGKRLIVLTSSA